MDDSIRTYDALVSCHRKQLAGKGQPVLIGTYISCKLVLHAATSDSLMLCGEDADLVYETIGELTPALRDLPRESVRALAAAAVQELAAIGTNLSESEYRCDCEDDDKPETIH